MRLLPVTGLCRQVLHWPSVFHIFGSLGVLWWGLWEWRAASSPDVDPRCGSEERELLASTTITRVRLLLVCAGQAAAQRLRQHCCLPQEPPAAGVQRALRRWLLCRVFGQAAAPPDGASCAPGAVMACGTPR